MFVLKARADPSQQRETRCGARRNIRETRRDRRRFPSWPALMHHCDARSRQRSPCGRRLHGSTPANKLGMFSVPGKGESMDTAAGDLDRRAESGNCEAQLALARRYETEHRTALARGWYARAAKQGSVAGLRALAINLLTMPPIVARDGVNMIRSAAHKGDAEAAYVCAMLAAQDHLLDNRWEVARECLMRAAERGWEPARL